MGCNGWTAWIWELVKTCYNYMLRNCFIRIVQLILFGCSPSHRYSIGKSFHEHSLWYTLRASPRLDMALTNSIGLVAGLPWEIEGTA
jgi:hypothetical protein